MHEYSVPSHLEWIVTLYEEIVVFDVDAKSRVQVFRWHLKDYVKMVEKARPKNKYECIEYQNDDYLLLKIEKMWYLRSLCHLGRL